MLPSGPKSTRGARPAARHIYESEAAINGRGGQTDRQRNCSHGRGGHGRGDQTSKGSGFVTSGDCGTTTASVSFGDPAVAKADGNAQEIHTAVSSTRGTGLDVQAGSTRHARAAGCLRVFACQARSLLLLPTPTPIWTRKNARSSNFRQRRRREADGQSSAAGRPIVPIVPDSVLIGHAFRSTEYVFSNVECDRTVSAATTGGSFPIEGDGDLCVEMRSAGRG